VLPRIQALGRRRLRFPKFVAFLFLLGFLLTAVIAFAPGSNATRSKIDQSPPDTGDSNKTKRGRREFVPGEVLVRFKQNKAMLGAMSLLVPDNRSGRVKDCRAAAADSGSN